MNGYRTSEAANLLKINIETIRYYEKRGLLQEIERSEAGYRCFNEDHLRRISFIRGAKEFGFTLREIKDMVDSGMADAISKQKYGDEINDPEMEQRTNAIIEQKLLNIDEEIKRLQETKEKLKEFCEYELQRKVGKSSTCLISDGTLPEPKSKKKKK